MADRKNPTTKDIYLLSQRPDLAPQFDEVYGEGSAQAILFKVKPQSVQQTVSPFTQQAPQAPQPEGSYTGAAIRGLAGPMLGAAVGAPFGPVGMLAGSLALPAADALTSLINTATAGAEKLTGGNYPRMTTPSQSIQDLLTQAGVPQATTGGQRNVQAGMSALGGTASSLPGMARLATTSASNLGQRIAGQMAARPTAQIALATPAGATGQAVSEATQPYLGDVGSALASMVGSGVVGGVGMGLKTPTTPRLSNAEIRAQDIANKARALGFKDETALTPAQAGTNRIPQIFEATASNIPGSAGQFRKRYGAQSDLAENIINNVASMFGGMPESPDAAFSSGASAIKRATARNVDTIGSSIRQVASQTDIDLSQVPSFQNGVMKARQLLSSIPPSLRKDPLFQSFEEFYFGKPNEELKTMIDSALQQAGISPTNPNYKSTIAQFRKQLVDSGIPEYEFQGYAQKGMIPGNDYQDQRKLFSDLAYTNRGTKIGEAFRSLRDTLDNARDETFRLDGMDDQVIKLKELRSSYGKAKDLNDSIATTGDKTAVKYVSTNQNNLANEIIPLMSAEEKRALAQGVLADINLSSMMPTGELDITKFGRNVIKNTKSAPSALPQILGADNATTLTNLAQVAQSALKSKVPTSGTSERTGMMNLITSTPAKIGAAIASGTALTGEPILGTALALGTPALATKAYLSPAVQKFYGNLNITDPLVNYMASPLSPTMQYMATPGAAMGMDELRRRSLEEYAQRNAQNMPGLLD